MKFFSQFNIAGQCRKYGISIWQCPEFLFLAMGALIVLSSAISYMLGTRYVAEPQLVAFFVLVLAGILLVFAFIITQSFERLASANRLKSELVSVVSHQLRAPISNIKWALEFLMSGRAGRVEEDQTGYFRILKENSNRMQELVNDLLMVSKIEQGDIAFRREEFSLRALLEEVLGEYSSFIQASNIDITVQGDEAIQNIVNDPRGIRMVIENLLDNAIRYVGKDMPSVSSKEKRQSAILIKYTRKGPHVYFEIEDNGVGIPREDQKYIFQRFFRAKNILHHQTQGSGLGLYIAKSVIEKAGGKIGFHSQEHKGSKFWFTIPIR